MQYLPTPTLPHCDNVSCDHKNEQQPEQTKGKLLPLNRQQLVVVGLSLVWKRVRLERFYHVFSLGIACLL